MTVRNGVPVPPAHLAVFVNALGVERAIEFLLNFGGAELYVPREFKGNSRIVTVIGHDGALSIARVRDRLPARIPTGKPWIAKVWHSKGLSKAEIARRLHVSDVSVRRMLSDEPPSDPRQPSLFD